MPWYLWPLAPLMFPVVLLVMLPLALVAFLSVLMMPLVLYAQRRRELHFSRQMRAQGRFVSWAELEPRLQDGVGTLVVEQAQKQGVRVWWTEDDVVQEAPVPVIPEPELDFFRRNRPMPFVSWCFGRYLHRESGKAFLTEPAYSYPPGFLTAGFFKDRFPKMQVVVTVKLV